MPMTKAAANTGYRARNVNRRGSHAYAAPATALPTPNSA
jgi:hypothetical protein